MDEKIVPQHSKVIGLYESTIVDVSSISTDWIDYNIMSKPRQNKLCTLRVCPVKRKMFSNFYVRLVRIFGKHFL